MICGILGGCINLKIIMRGGKKKNKHQHKSFDLTSSDDSDYSEGRRDWGKDHNGKSYS